MPEDYDSDGSATEKGSNVSFSEVESTVDSLPLQRRLFTRLLWNKQVPPIPLDSERKPMPYYTASWPSRLLLFWMTSLFNVGYKRTATQKDLWTLGDDMSLKSTYPRFQKHLEQVLGENKDKQEDGKWANNALQKALYRCFKTEIIAFLFLSGLACTVYCLVPLVTKHLIQSIELHSLGVPGTVGKGVGYAVGISIMLALNTVITNHSLQISGVVGVNVCAILNKAIVEQSLRASAETRHRFPAGAVMSFVGTDLDRINQLFFSAVNVAGLPPSLIVGIVLLCINLKAVALVGVAAFLLVAASSLVPAVFYGKFRDAANIETDLRASLTRQMLQSMQMIKFYSWEDAYERILLTVRAKEISWVYKMQIIFAFLFANALGASSLTSMAAFLVMYAVDGLRGADVVFSSLTLFSVLTQNTNEFTFNLSFIIDGLKSITRIQKYLESDTETDLLESFYDSNDTLDDQCAVNINNATFFWEEFADLEESKDEKSLQERSDKPQDEPTLIKTQNTILHNVSLSISQGEFVVITGVTGSGKSSLLSAIAGLIGKSTGSVSKHGSILLCGAPTVMNATIKDNILFGEQYDSRKYKQVLNVCALESDLDMFQARDMTEVGERGVTLSGGQKARVNLARAVYREKDIYLFDDVISAVDANVGKHIIDKCMLDYLVGKTRVLATHNLAVIQKADKVIFINEDGTVECGPEADLLSTNKQFQALMTFKNEVKERPVDWEMENIESEAVAPITIRKPSAITEKDGLLVQDEERAVNSVPMSLYLSYFAAGGGKLGILMLPIVLFVTSLAIFVSLFSNVWLTYWLEGKFKSLTSGEYIGIYVLLSVLSWLIVAIEMCILGVVLSVAAKNLHIGALRRVLHTPMSFLNSTPIGRILNRFTKDTNALDNQLPSNLKLLLHIGTQLIGILILAIIYVPWFAIAIPFIAFVFLALCNYSQATAREVKRLEAINRSFVMNNVNEVLNGMDTIRAYGVQEAFDAKNERLIDQFNEVSFLVSLNRRWIGLALGLLASGIVLIITIFSATGVFGLSAAATGLLTNYMIQFADLSSFILNTYTVTENEMNSVERTYHYANDLIQEAPYRRNDTQPSPTWPENGTIKFDKVSLRYRDGLPLVLKNLSMEVGKFEKIGICGRTGAGKSSLMNVLFRINEVESGSVIIDGVDISRLGLYELRSKLSIIPQDPVLFQGTIKSNLDPFGDQSDEELWEALRRGGLIKDVATVKSGEIKDHKFHLDSVVEEDGSNFSLGERQLIALTRALVRRSKILVMDEATSSVDYETDSLVQTTIAREFKDCTILCIAHRLKTILKYDRVLVLEKGEFDEFDEPYKLFNKGGRFREMCASAGITEADFVSE